MKRTLTAAQRAWTRSGERASQSLAKDTVCYRSAAVLPDVSLTRVDNFANFGIFGNFLAMGHVDPSEMTNTAPLRGCFLEKDCERNRDSRAF